MPGLDALADSVFDTLIDTDYTIDRDALAFALQPNATLTPTYYGPANHAHYENARILGITALTDSGSYVAKATVDTTQHGDLPLRFTEHTLTITCRDLGVVHPTMLVGHTVGVTYGDDLSRSYFDDGNADLCFTNPETDEKELVDAGLVYEHRVDDSTPSDDRREESA